MTQTILITIGFLLAIFLVSRGRVWLKRYKEKKFIKERGGIVELFRQYIVPSLPLHCELENPKENGDYVCFWENKFGSSLRVVFSNDVLTFYWRNPTNIEGHFTDTSFTFVHPLLASETALFDGIAKARRDHYQKHQINLHDQVYRK